jgi:FkbM family methyltransferase
MTLRLDMKFVRTVAQHLPIDLPLSGRKRNALFSVLDPLCRHLRKQDVIDTKLGSLVLDYAHPPERLLSYAFYNLHRFYARSDLGRYISAHLKPGMTFVDVGANLGFYSLLARQAGADAVLIEPEPNHASYLERNSAVFGKILHVAISDSAGTLPLYYLPSNTGATSLIPAPGFIEGGDIVPVQTFSALAHSGQLGDAAKIALIKLDVEGVEVEAIRGMKEFLQRGHRPPIWCELRGDRADHTPGTFRAVRDILTGFGYEARDTKGRHPSPAQTDKWADLDIFDLLFVTN